jgi:hypothetical protein
VRPIKIFKHTTINHQVAGLWPNRPGDGKAAPFCGHDNSTKIQCLGGGLAIAELGPAGQILLAHTVSLLNHTTINLSVEVACKRGGGCRTCKPGGGPDHGGKEEEEGCGQSLGKEGVGKEGGGKRGVNGKDDGKIDGGGDGNGNNWKQRRTFCPALPQVRRRRAWWGAAVPDSQA